MASDKVTITIKGGAPWGFRLFGGESLPLTIARLRRKSKAQECGLQEGDTLLTINGYSCKDMSHATAMALVDSSGQSLTMTVLRGNPDKHALDAAFQTLGPSKVVPAHMLHAQPRSKTYSPNAELDLQDHMDMNGDLNGPLDNVQRTQETFYGGDNTRHVTTETSQQKFGSTTVTKVSREELTTSGGGWQSPSSQRRIQQQTEVSSAAAPSMFNVNSYGTNVSHKPGVWSPSGAGTQQSQQPMGISVSAPDGVSVQHHPDHSVTMTIGLTSPRQGNVPSFSVSNVSKVTSQPKGVWAPSTGTLDLRRPSPQPQPAITSPRGPLSPTPEPDDLQFYDAFDHFDAGARDSPITRIPVNPPLIQPLHLSELIKGESFSDEEYLDSPTRKKKKVPTATLR